MKKFDSVTKPLMWFMALLLATVVVGCGSGDGNPADATAPTVSSTAPANAATGIALNANITATFSEAMMASTITDTTFTLKQGTTPVTGLVSYLGKTATFNPTGNLAPGLSHTATLTTGVKDLAGNALAVTKTWSFTTGILEDTTAPIVSSTVPANAATGIAVNANIDANFNEVMDESTITDVTFTLKQGAAVVPGAVSYLGTIATFNPSVDLLTSTDYTATVSTGVKDLAGIAMALDKVWSFTTGTTVAAGPIAVDLLSVGTNNFVILATTQITEANPGLGAITGNIGLSPAAGSFVFVTCAEMTGLIYTVDATYVGSGACMKPGTTGGIPNADKTLIDNAILDMGTAYLDAAGRAPGVGATNLNVGGGTLTGNNFAPGTYTWGTDVNITGDITLTGGANDVWLFQISGNLNIAPGASVPAGIKVVLGGAAKASNVFWQVGGGSGATLGTYATFNGNILSATQVVMQTGAVLHGRALAKTLVSLDGNSVGP